MRAWFGVWGLVVLLSGSVMAQSPETMPGAVHEESLRIEDLRHRLMREREKLLMSEEQIQQVHDYIKKLDPEWLEELEKLQVEHPWQYDIKLKKAFADLKHLMAIKEIDTQRYEQLWRIRELEAESRSLGRDYRDASGAAKAETLKELRTVVEELFDLREKERQREIEKLEERLQSLKSTLDTRKKNKDKIVSHRVDELTGKAKQYEWD
jgi:hypothetical protein